MLFSCKNDSDDVIDRNLLMGVWGQNQDLDSDFRISEKEFFIVDFFETSEYTLSNDTIKIDGSAYYETGVIKNLTKDSLTIYWVDIDVTSSYVRYTN